MKALCEGLSRTRRLDAPALRVSVSARRRHHSADGGRQAAAVPRHPVPARQPAHPEADEAAGRGRQDARAHPALARRSARTSPSAAPSSSASRARPRTSSSSCSTSSTRRSSTASARSPIRRSTAPAANALPDPVPEDVKQERLARFMARQAEICAAKLEAQGRHACSAAWSMRSTASWRSRARWPTRRRSTAWCRSRTALEAGLKPGQFVDVEILGSDEHDLYGEVGLPSRIAFDPPAPPVLESPGAAAYPAARRRRWPMSSIPLVEPDAATRDAAPSTCEWRTVLRHRCRCG